jgi:hypothetical protein
MGFFIWGNSGRSRDCKSLTGWFESILPHEADSSLKERNRKKSYDTQRTRLRQVKQTGGMRVVDQCRL